jgi:imidazolonepropionase-like amidohydrolase
MFSGLPTVLAAFLLFVQDANERPVLDTPVVIRNATIVPSPGQKIESAMVLIEDGRISAVGKDVAVPAGAREIDAAGGSVYAGFLDGFTRLGLGEAKVSAAEERRVEDEFESSSEGPRLRFESANRNGIFARRRAEDLLDVQEKTYANGRNAGFVAAMIAPPQGVLGGSAAVLALGDKPVRRSLLATGTIQTASFVPPTPRSLSARDRYPATTFGVMAHFRQALLDARWWNEMREYVKRNPQAAAELPHDPDLEVLQDVLAGRVPLAWEADDFEEIHRALNLAEEFRFRPIIVGGRKAHLVAERLAATKTPVVLTLTLPKKPDEYKWDASGLTRSEGGRELLPKGWEKRAYLPAAAYEEASKRREEELKTAIALEKAGVAWCISTHGLSQPADGVKLLREMIEAGLPADAAVRALTTAPAKLLGVERELGTIEKGKRGSVVVLNKALEEKDAEVRSVVVDGRVFDFDPFADRSRGRGRRGGRDGGDDKDKGEKGATAKAESQPASQPESAPAAKPDPVLAHEPKWPIENNAARDPGLKTGGNVLLKNALVLPVSGEDQPNTSILVEGGKIKAIGRDLAAPAGTKTIDLTGYVVMPGIIDPHSHIALDSVNEGTLSVVPEVRCDDVVRSDDLDIYHALAGGVTTIHAMHGSANTIGGQCVQMKLKWGQPASAMIIQDRVKTVKFATGENVTRGGRPGQGRQGQAERARRFPGTRMGVEAVMRRALQAGREYDQQRTTAASTKEGKPLRRDLRLEALADIVTGKIWINCHCYRADEILRLLNVAEDFGVRIGALHHCLEAYRIMPEIARHGCGTATFSDWWAYKVEAYDAVPQNAAMLMRAGINSTIKSDSAELMRHMPLEAAKSIRFGGLSPREALTTITLNPARMFGLEKRTGSIEVGKDADLAVFDGHPLDTFSHCVLTFVDGECYFRHRDFDAAKATKPAREAAAFVVPPPAIHIPIPNSDTAKKDNGVYAIVGGTIHPVSGPSIERGTLVIRAGRIDAIGADVTPPPDAQVIAADGRHVWPGVINACSTIGLQEIGAVDVTQDSSDAGLYMPDLTALGGLNPHSAMIGVARAEGLTTALLVPGGSRIAGQGSLVHLNGWTASEMLLDAKLGLVVRLPGRSVEPILDRKPPPDRDREFEEARNKEREDEQATRQLRELEEFFRDARLYAARRGGGSASELGDPRFEAMIPYVRGERPVLFDADSYKSILEALTFAERHHLKAVILGGRDAWKLADLLAAQKTPVIFDAVFDIPAEVPAVSGASEEWDAQYRAAGALDRAGVPFCIGYRDAALAKNLPLMAGFSVAHGLSPDAGVRAITLSAAEILGVEKQLGSLTKGAIADVLVTTGHLCQAAARIEEVFVAGHRTELENKHTRDSEHFAHRPAGELAPPRTDLHGPQNQSAGVNR